MLQFIYNAIWPIFNKHFQVISFRQLIFKTWSILIHLQKWLLVTSFDAPLSFQVALWILTNAPYLKTYATENTVCREILFDILLQ